MKSPVECSRDDRAVRTLPPQDFVEVDGDGPLAPALEISRSSLAAMNKSVHALLIALRRLETVRTLGSAIMPGVCVCTTICTNLMQHIRTPTGDESILRRILDLMVDIVCHNEGFSG